MNQIGYFLKLHELKCKPFESKWIKMNRNYKYMDQNNIKRKKKKK